MSIKDIMRIGIIRYPGSNCDIDVQNYLKNDFQGLP